METLTEIWAFLRVRKKFWLLPIVLALLVLGTLIWVASSSSVVSPLIYL